MVNNSTEKQLGGATGKGFMPGQSGNPAGRPKGTLSLLTILKEELANIPEELKDKPIEEKKDWARVIVGKWIHNAGVKGEQPSIDKMVDRIDGPVKQEIEHSGGIDVLMKLDPKEEELLKQLIESRKK